MVMHNYVKRGRVLKPSPRRARKGGPITHYAVNLGRNDVRRIHRLVLEAFVGPAPDGCVCCHYDGDCANNHLENLRWDTQYANTQDSIRHGTKRHPPKHFGENHPRTELTDDRVRYIRARPRERGLAGKLAAELGVSRKTVYDVMLHKVWNHV